MLFLFFFGEKMITAGTFHGPHNDSKNENYPANDRHKVISNDFSRGIDRLMKKKAQDHYEEAKASNQRTPRSVGHMHTMVVERLFFRMILTRSVVVFPSLISGFDDWRTGEIVFFDR